MIVNFNFLISNLITNDEVNENTVKFSFKKSY